MLSNKSVLVVKGQRVSDGHKSFGVCRFHFVNDGGRRDKLGIENKRGISGLKEGSWQSSVFPQSSHLLENISQRAQYPCMRLVPLHSDFLPTTTSLVLTCIPHF